MKKTYLKIVSIVLTMLMLVGTMTMLVPLTASAEGEEPIYLEKNKTATINGITYRFDTTNADEEESWARINPDGTWEMNIRHGDMLWFPDVKMSDTSSVYGEVTNSTSAPNNYFTGLAYGVTGATAYETTNVAVVKTYNGGMRFRITGASRTGLMTISGTDYGNGGDSPRVYDAKYTPNDAYNSIAHKDNKNWDGGKTVYFKVSQTTDKVEVEFGTPSVGYFVDPSITTYAKGSSNTYTLANGSVGYTMVWGSNSHTQVRIDKLDVTNCTVAGEAKSSYSLVKNGTEEEPNEPVAPETPSVINLTPNADNWINGQNYRLETSKSDSYAKIENGKLIVKMSSGDLFWIPSLTVKDTTSEFSFTNMSTDTDGTRIAVATHIAPKQDGVKMYSTGIANNGNNVWVSNRLKWSGNGVTIADYDKHYKNDVDWSDSTKAPTDGNWQKGENLNIRNIYATWGNLVPKTIFNVGNSAAAQFIWYPQINTGCENTSFGLTLASGSATVSVDTITATNMNGVASYKETFDGVLVPVEAVKDAAVSLSLDGTIGLNFAFTADTRVLANATIVATKNGEKVAEQAVVNGENTITVPVAAKEMGDAVNFSIVVDGAVFEGNSYTTSVAEYADALKANADWAELMNAMLNYGAAAQNLFGYKTDALVGNVDAIAYDFSGYEAVVYAGDRSLLKGLHTNLSLESDTTLKLYFMPSDGVELNVTVDGKAAKLVDNGDGYYVLSIDGIAADKLGADFEIVVNGALSFKVNALDWAKLASANADANVANAAKALAAYADAAAKMA